MASLREELAKLSSTVPEFKDPEDFYEDDTVAKLTEKDDNDDEVVEQSSKLRKRAAVILGDSDRKYAGKRISRKKINELSDIDNQLSISNDDKVISEDEDSDQELSNSDEDLEGDYSDDTGKSGADNSDEGEEELESFQSKFKSATLQDDQQEFSFNDDGDFSKYADDYENGDDMSEESGDEDIEEDGDDLSDESDEIDENEDMNDDHGNQDEGVKSFSKTSVMEEIKKGEAAKQQLGLWDSFLEGRIKLQKVAGIINQMPQFDVWQQFEKEGGDDFKQSAAETQSLLKKLLDKLVQLQTILLLQNYETRHIVNGNKEDIKKAKDNDDDEEIPSDTDEEEKPEQKQEPVQLGVKRKIKLDNYPEFLAKRHKDFQDFRNNTIQKWYDKTRLSDGKIRSKSFSSFDQSALKQIEQILGDKERLVKRTQLKRSVYSILGKPEEDQSTATPIEQEETEILGDNLKSYDAEIFDDNDFYHQQLRELIERKTADIEDPVALSRQWLEIQKLRNKVKKKIDTRASKGRKTRYNVHSKLVNFMAQMDNCVWTDESKDDLFKSLFGKRFQNMNSTESTQNIT